MPEAAAVWGNCTRTQVWWPRQPLPPACPCCLQLILGNQILAEEKHLPLYKASPPPCLLPTAGGAGAGAIRGWPKLWLGTAQQADSLALLLSVPHARPLSLVWLLRPGLFSAPALAG